MRCGHGGAVLDDHEHMEAAQVDRVDMREVDSEGGVGLRGQELAPGRSQPLRGGVDARGPSAAAGSGRRRLPGLSTPAVISGCCGGGQRPRDAAPATRRPWMTRCAPTTGPGREPAGRSGTASAATRRRPCPIPRWPPITAAHYVRRVLEPSQGGDRERSRMACVARSVMPAVRDDDDAVIHDADENRAFRAVSVVRVAPSSSR